MKVLDNDTHRVKVTPLHSPSHQHVVRRTALVGMMMRSCINGWVAGVALCDPGPHLEPIGAAILIVLAAWSGYRLVSRSLGRTMQIVDLSLVLAAIALTPAVAPQTTFTLSSSTTQVLAGAAVASFAVAVPARLSAVIALAVALTYTWAVGRAGTAITMGASALYLFTLQWVAASAIRWMMVRVAAVADRGRERRLRNETGEKVQAAVWAFQHEQLALLHDTAASTLLMAAHNTHVDPRRLARQARRDLRILSEPPWQPPPSSIDIPQELRRAAEQVDIAITIDGHSHKWLPGPLARAVIGAARETITNTERHAHASKMWITVTDTAVTLRDDGHGFDTRHPRTGYGLRHSVIGRMRRAGGDASITSTASDGCVTELHWHHTDDLPVTAEEPQHLIERMRRRFGIALTGYALANLVFMTASIPDAVGDRLLQLVLGVAAGVSAVAGIVVASPRRKPVLAAAAAVALLAVTIVQPALLPITMVGGQAHWALGAVGWCALPWLLSLPIRTGAAVLAALWALAVIVTLARAPSAHMVVALGVSTASILAPQLFAIIFNKLIRQAAIDADTESTRLHQAQLAAHTRQAIRDEYQRRYAALVDTVAAVLSDLAVVDHIDSRLRHRAATESRKLRTLFDDPTNFGHPLMGGLRGLCDAAEAHGIDITVDVANTLPELCESDITALLEPLTWVLHTPADSARIVVLSLPDDLAVSAVCRGSPLAQTNNADWPQFGLGTEITTESDTIWLSTQLSLLRSKQGRPEKSLSVRSGPVRSSAQEPEACSTDGNSLRCHAKSPRTSLRRLIARRDENGSNTATPRQK